MGSWRSSILVAPAWLGSPEKSKRHCPWAQLAEASPVDAHLAKQLGAVLTQAGGVAAPPVFEERYGRGDLEAGRTNVDQVPRGDVWVAANLFELEHRLAAELAAAEGLLPIVPAAAGEDLLHLRVQRVLLLALGVLGGHQVRPAQHLAQGLPELGLQRPDAEETAVRGLVDAVAGVAPGQPVHAAVDPVPLGLELGQRLGDRLLVCPHQVAERLDADVYGKHEVACGNQLLRKTLRPL